MIDSAPILLVEDDDVDALITQRALNDINVTNELVHKFDGEEAVEYLRQEHDKLPSVILLDLNMPKMNGFEFLKVIKDDPVLKIIPVVVLTTSDTEQNVVESYGLGVAGYIIKPVDYKQFVEAMRTVKMYWTLSKSPHKELRSLSMEAAEK